MKRRDFFSSVATAALAPSVSCSVSEAPATGPVDVGSSRQLFLDDLWFDKKENVRLAFHTPTPREIVIRAKDHPWEPIAHGLHYSCVLKDGDRFRMWYRVDVGKDARALTCHAESQDGVHWEKPDLGIVEWKGSKKNNLVFPAGGVEGINASIILDPNGSGDERYKMITRPSGRILGFASGDGLHWKPVAGNPLIDNPPVDSHNILLWDDEKKRYVIYLRGIDRSRAGDFKGGIRAIRRAESEDFLHWSTPELVVSADDQDPEDLNLYTNATVKYERAQRAYLMFPMVLYTRRHYEKAPGPETTSTVPGLSPTFAGLSDTQFASSRDGIHWDRRRKPFLGPGRDERSWCDRNPIMGVGILQTAPDELSMYYSDFLRYPESHFRRATLRTDGFVSVEGPYDGWGEFTTPPLVFSGKQLEMNYRTSGGGTILVELQQQDGRPIPGFLLDDCPPIFGDKIDAAVHWKERTEVGSLADRPVRLRIRLRDAELFAFRFAA